MRNISAEGVGDAFNWSDKHGPFSFALTQTSKHHAVQLLHFGRRRKHRTLQEVRKLWKLGICPKLRMKSKHLKPIPVSILNWKVKGLTRLFEDRKQTMFKMMDLRPFHGRGCGLRAGNVGHSSLKSHQSCWDETQIPESLPLCPLPYFSPQ